jgi:hypothetical protein
MTTSIDPTTPEGAAYWRRRHEAEFAAECATAPLAIRLLREDVLGNIDDGFAVAYAAYKKSFAAVEDLDPKRFGGPGKTPLSLMDEAVIVLMHDAWEAGVYIGDAFARAESALEVERRTCRR